MDDKRYESVNCCICDKDNSEVLYEADYEKAKEINLEEKFRSSGDEFLVDRVVKCKECGLVYVNPRLKRDFIAKGYIEGTDEKFASQAKGREITFGKCLNMIERYIQKGRLLDVGTANGSFPYMAKQNGWKVQAVEPNKWLCEWAKKNYHVDVKSGFLKEQAFPDRQFDVVTMWDVLEHTINPKEELLEVNRILKNNGLVVINFPDVGSVFARIFKRRWWFFLSVHLFYFNGKTIKRLLNDCGFEVVAGARHIQRLSFGYLVERFKVYNEVIYRVLHSIVAMLKMEGIQIPYYAGQTNLIARKMTGKVKEGKNE